MGIQLRLPDIKGSDSEQLRQIRSYLYQLVPQLQWALDTSEKAASSTVTPTAAAATAVPDAQSVLSARAASAETTELGLSESVLAPEQEFGRGGAGCRCCAVGNRIFVFFSCACADAAFPVRVNASLLPEPYRPSAPVRTVCAAEFADGEHGVAGAQITPEGEVSVIWARGIDGGAVPSAIDGCVWWTTAMTSD